MNKDRDKNKEDYKIPLLSERQLFFRGADDYKIEIQLGLPKPKTGLPLPTRLPFSIQKIITAYFVDDIRLLVELNTLYPGAHKLSQIEKQQVYAAYSKEAIRLMNALLDLDKAPPPEWSSRKLIALTVILFVSAIILAIVTTSTNSEVAEITGMIGLAFLIFGACSGIVLCRKTVCRSERATDALPLPINLQQDIDHFYMGINTLRADIDKLILQQFCKHYEQRPC